MRIAIQCWVLFSLVLCVFSSCSFEPSVVLKQRTQPVVGGDKESRFPGVVNVFFTYRSTNGKVFRKQVCTGTLIRSNAVLTAATCIKSFAELKKIYFTDPSRVSRLSEYRPQIEVTMLGKSFAYSIKSSHKHPKASHGKFGHDFGLFMLERKVKEVAPVPLYRGSFLDAWYGKRALVLGYGEEITWLHPEKVSGVKRSLEAVLEKANVSIIPQELQSLQFRFSTQSKILCVGDEGAPVFYKVDGNFQVIGVHSWVEEKKHGYYGTKSTCAGPSFFGKIEVGRAWIEETLAKTGQSSCSSDIDCGDCFSCQSGICAHKCKDGEICQKEESDSKFVCSSFDEALKKKAVCGNGTCEEGENCNSCASDCGCQYGDFCSKQGVCQQKGVCGDGVCDANGGENCGSCYVDCSCKGSQTCQKDICVDEQPKEEPKTVKEPIVEKLPCPESEQVTACDEQGKNCKHICSNMESQGCSILPRQNNLPLLPFLLLFLLLSMRSSQSQRG